MSIYEPQRGINLLQALNNRTSSSQIIFKIMTILADAVVLLFPIFLLTVYILGIIKKNKNYKQYSLYILFSTIIAAIINAIIQHFFTKLRPETVLETGNHLILKHLPTMSFPSDHAGVSMAFAIALFFGLYLINKKDKKIFIGWAIFFLTSSIIMSVARVAVGVHWPTDILAGWTVGFISGCIIYFIPIKVNNFLISIEEFILLKLFNIKKSI